MKKLVSMVCVASLLASNTVVFAEEETKEELDKKLEQNKESQKRLDEEIQTVRLSIREVEARLQETSSQIKVLENQINELNKESESLKVEIEKNKDLLAQRLKVIQENQSLGYIKVILSSESISQFFDNIYMVKQVVESDKKLLENLDKNKSELDENKKSVEDKKQEMQNLKSSLEEDNVKLNEKKVEIEELKKQLEEEEQEIEDKLQELASRTILSDGQIAVISEGSWPVPSAMTISSNYGYRIHPIFNTRKMHTGIDIPAPTGTPAVAIDDGTVIFAGVQNGYGNTVMIQHDDGKVTLYAHNNSMLVSKGDRVVKGQVVSKIGSTGYSTGPHLHFEVRINGNHVDPMKYITR